MTTIQRTHPLHTGFVALGAMLLAGCMASNGGQKQTIGTIGGAVAGGLLGAQFGSGKGQIVAAIAGTALGAYVGSEIGRYLDEQDRSAQAEATQSVLERETPTRVAWSNPETGVKGQVESSPVRRETVYKTVYKTEEVRSSPKMNLLGQDYQATKAANVRAEPTTDSDVVNALRAGEVFHAVGHVSGKNWILAARGNQTIGYVHQSLVEPVAGQSTEPTIVYTPPAIKGVKRVAVPVERRTVTRKVTLADGSVKKESIDFCRPETGAWEKCASS